jgi:hypothetical protein
VIANATPVALPAGAGEAIVHFEITVASIRAEMAQAAEGIGGRGRRWT